MASQQGVSVAHYDMRFLKPIDTDILHSVGRKFKKVVTVENGVVTGGLGSAVLEFFADNGYSPKVVRLGLPDSFVEHGTIPELLAECHLDVTSICETLITI